jgi:hypothetical protein
MAVPAIAPPPTTYECPYSQNHYGIKDLFDISLNICHIC